MVIAVTLVALIKHEWKGNRIRQTRFHQQEEPHNYICHIKSVYYSVTASSENCAKFIHNVQFLFSKLSQLYYTPIAVLRK